MLETGRNSRSTGERNSVPSLLRQREAGEPINVNINGKLYVVKDDASFSRLLDLVERLETLDGIRAGLDDMKARRTRPVEEFFEELKPESENQRA
jgi:hypothetical protein